ncbi:MAG TPA: polysaccharide deacetylase [Clostridia bacterium]|nr:polysaccharide deacetylase [Clostridia bacterium]
MYLGSVRFYKHVIYLSMALILVGLILGIYALGKELLGRFTLPSAGAAETVAAAVEEVIPPPPEAEEEAVQPAAFDQLPYQTAFPELYALPPAAQRQAQNVAYLTFDDGPSARTLEILDILKEHEIKATFFVVTENCDAEILKRIVAEGHAIGIHTHSHKYTEIYRSVEDYLADFQKAYDIIYQATSVKPDIFRFPGGSINSYNRGIYQELISEMLRRGFVYYDWNISTLDTVPRISAEKIIQHVASSIQGQSNLFILAHDSGDKRNTVEALPEIIDLVKARGYVFDKIENSVKPVVFAYPE